MKKIFDLPVCGSDRAKSFYGKAKIIETDNGEKVLHSYNTFVLNISRYESHRYAFEIHQYTQVIHP